MAFHLSTQKRNFRKSNLAQQCLSIEQKQYTVLELTFGGNLTIALLDHNKLIIFYLLFVYKFTLSIEPEK